MRTPLAGAAVALPLVLAPAPDRPAQALPVGAGAAHCLALALYFEAKSEGPEGMRAVGSVVLNRVRHPDFPNEVCAVVTEGGEAPPCQFSWWCDGKSDHPSEPEAWREARALAADILADHDSDPTGGALFFHNTGIRTPWRKPRQRTVQIGRHVFYR